MDKTLRLLQRKAHTESAWVDYAHALERALGINDGVDNSISCWVLLHQESTQSPDDTYIQIFLTEADVYKAATSLASDLLERRVPRISMGEDQLQHTSEYKRFYQLLKDNEHQHAFMIWENEWENFETTGLICIEKNEIIYEPVAAQKGPTSLESKKLETEHRF